MYVLLVVAVIFFGLLLVPFGEEEYQQWPRRRRDKVRSAVCND